MGVLGAFQQNAFQNDAFQVNDYFGFEQTGPVNTSSTRASGTQCDGGQALLPPLVGIWGYENTYPAPAKVITLPATNDQPLPALLGLWGWENAYPAPAKLSTLPATPDQPLPALLGLWGWENAYPAPARVLALQATHDQPLPSIFGPWGWENAYPLPAKLSSLHAAESLSFAPLAGLLGIWGFENVFPAPARPVSIFPVSYEPLPARLGFWGWDNEPLVLAKRQTSPVFTYDVLPGLAPVPVPPFTIHLLTGGGGFKEYEIIDDYSERAIDDYIRMLYEDDFEGDVDDEGPIDPDAVLGKAELEDERKTRQQEQADGQKPRFAPPKTIYRFESVLDPISCHRVVMFANDARNQGMPVATTDAFRLRYKLGIFEEAYEKKMLEGSMVKIVPKRESDLAKLSKLAAKHKYKLVAWTDEGLFLFDETTLRPKASGLLWMALGAGWGLILGHALWKKT